MLVESFLADLALLDFEDFEDFEDLADFEDLLFDEGFALALVVLLAGSAFVSAFAVLALVFADFAVDFDFAAGFAVAVACFFAVSADPACCAWAWSCAPANNSAAAAKRDMRFIGGASWGVRAIKPALAAGGACTRL